MKEIERGSVKYLILLIVATAIFGIILYPLFDLILCKWITQKDFVYSVHSHIIQPVTFAVVYGTTFWALSKNRKDK